MSTTHIFKDFRDDGFPLCPQCDQDELYSHVVRHWNSVRAISPMPAIQEILKGDFTCYACNWTSEKPLTPAETVSELIGRLWPKE